ncbi:MAG: 50S ribosomal protein L18 [Patescibacteria group bacterium]
MKIVNPQKLRVASRRRRHGRVRALVHGTAARPRLSVFRSARHIVAQLIDDERGRTLVYASDAEMKKAPAADPVRGRPVRLGQTTTASGRSASNGIDGMAGKVARAYAVGRLLAERAAARKITAAVFDRGGYRYHGRVKALADGARSGGLQF